jgi:hypothetical protein
MTQLPADCFKQPRSTVSCPLGELVAVPWLLCELGEVVLGDVDCCWSEVLG